MHLLKILASGMKARENGSNRDAEAFGDLLAAFAFEFVKDEYSAMVQIHGVQRALDPIEPLRGFSHVARPGADCRYGRGIFHIDLAGRATQAASPGGSHPHGDLRQPGRWPRLAFDETASFVSYYEHLLNQIVDFLRTNPKFPQKVRYEPGVATKQLTCIQALFRLGLAFCHVLYLPLRWIAGCLKTFITLEISQYRNLIFGPSEVLGDPRFFRDDTMDG